MANRDYRTAPVGMQAFSRNAQPGFLTGAADEHRPRPRLDTGSASAKAASIERIAVYAEACRQKALLLVGTKPRITQEVAVRRDPEHFLGCEAGPAMRAGGARQKGDGRAGHGMPPRMLTQLLPGSVCAFGVALRIRDREPDCKHSRGFSSSASPWPLLSRRLRPDDRRTW
jgi:hypothetical protein